jgi:hypothetical protein
MALRTVLRSIQGGEAVKAQKLSIQGAKAVIKACYQWNHPTFHLVPFEEFLLGASHASGSLAPGNSGLPGSSNAFALRTGGGLAIPLDGRISLRPVQLDYVMTDFANRKDDRQNNLQVSAGVVIHLRPAPDLRKTMLATRARAAATLQLQRHQENPYEDSQLDSGHRTRSTVPLHYR